MTMSGSIEWTNPLVAKLENAFLEASAGDCSNILWHYSGVEAMTGLLHTGKLWATDLDYLNDPDESNVLWDELRHYCESMHYLVKAPRVAEIAPSIANLVFNPAANPRTNPGEFRHFVACFSDSRDALGQWRMYGRDGRGYAIGLDARSLDRSASPQKPDGFERWSFGRVIYDANVARAVAIRAFDDTVAFAEQALASHRDDLDVMTVVVTVSTVLMGALHLIAPFFKGADYADEREMRVVVTATSRSKPQFRIRHEMLVPYVELPLGMAAVREVMTGPCHSQLSRLSMERLARDLTSGSVPVSHSQRRYRPL